MSVGYKAATHLRFCAMPTCSKLPYSGVATPTTAANSLKNLFLLVLVCFDIAVSSTSSQVIDAPESTTNNQICDPNSHLPCSTKSTNRYTSSMAMRIVRVDEFGDESKLKVVSVPIPQPKENEVLIRTEAIGVNPVEAIIRGGHFGNMVSVPWMPGSDAGGIVEQVGEGVKKLKAGDRVYTVKTTSGAYAELCTANIDYVVPLHDRLSFAQGAAIGVPYHVAYKALFIRADVKPKDIVLVHGASGAVGIAAVQMAKARGNIVIGTAGTDEGVELVKKQGADFVFNHRKDGHMDEVKAATGGKGVDVVLEMLANVNLVKDLEIAAFRGRIVVVGNKGSVENFNPSLTMGKELSILGVVVQVSTPEEYKILISGVSEGQDAGWLNPVIAHEYSLDQVAQAHKDILSDKGTKGKLVINPKL